ncbi:hypothetical protein BV372_03835 [Nostoc sp. T09]|uniref:NAD-dependent epimerase/dehydratase family protein n=1 Tax=Nostoc sp. T09 TaxID=1932621 RepID=UPI000A3AD67A|nr:NAD-dependent epimerase/dehydratase family protein [Nostoc sp. T09]OUL37136.1 hypothetical protein BV372_03835 [Nostoc sp. T09]
MNLLLGSSGYLGVNLLEYLDPNQTITVSRSSEKPEVLEHICLDIRDELTSSELQQIVKCRPSQIYILGRPTEDDFYINKRFYDNLKTLFLKLADDPILSTIHFFSTTLVYDGIKHITSSLLGEVKPYSFYEYFKLDFELFLHYLSLNIRPDIAVFIHRLPILFGGIFSPQKNSDQFLYSFINSYIQGNGWRFATEEDKKYGTSWAFTPDLCKAVTLPPSSSGFHLKNASSGFFTYFQLHELLVQYFGQPLKDELKLYRSYFNIDDELGLPQKSIDDAVIAIQSSIS